MTPTIWNVLGLPATRDETAIKRAYAAQLKLIDLDTDPGRFQELREARDAAIALARADPDQLVEDSKDGATPDVTEGADAPRDQRNSAPGVDEERVLTAEEAELRQRHQYLCEILFQIDGDVFYNATEDEAAAMLAHFEAILENPILKDISALSNAESWFAGAIAQMIPRSDVLIEPAVAAFGWSSADAIGSDPAIAAVVERHSDLQFARALNHADHPLHKAWKELLRPADESSSRGWVSRHKVETLLADIRTNHPTLERHLDWYRVGLWDRLEPRVWGGSLKENLIRGVLGLFLLSTLFSVLVAEPDQRYPAPSVPFAATYDPLSIPEDDIHALLLGVTKGLIGAPEVRKENAKLYQFLNEEWTRAKRAGQNRPAFMGEVGSVIDRHRLNLWTYAPADLLVERYTVRRDVLRALRERSAEACSNYLDGNDPPEYGELRDRMDQLVGREVLAIDPSRSLPATRATTIEFEIPGEVMGELGRRLKSDQREVVQALSGERGTTAYCDARLALHEAVLAMPTSRRTKVLRDMATD